MTTEARLISRETNGLLLIDTGVGQIKNGPELWINDGHLDGTAEGVADIGIVAKVHHAGSLRADAVVLLAGLGEDHHLGFERDVKLLEQLLQDIPVALAGDLHLAFFLRFLQALCRIIRRGVGVADGRVFILVLCARHRRAHRAKRAHHEPQRLFSEVSGRFHFLASAKLPSTAFYRHRSRDRRRCDGRVRHRTQQPRRPALLSTGTRR